MHLSGPISVHCSFIAERILNQSINQSINQNSVKPVLALPEIAAFHFCMHCLKDLRSKPVMVTLRVMILWTVARPSLSSQIKVILLIDEKPQK